MTKLTVLIRQTEDGLMIRADSKDTKITKLEGQVLNFVRQQVQNSLAAVRKQMLLESKADTTVNKILGNE